MCVFNAKTKQNPSVEYTFRLLQFYKWMALLLVRLYINILFLFSHENWAFVFNIILIYFFSLFLLNFVRFLYFVLFCSVFGCFFFQMNNSLIIEYNQNEWLEFYSLNAGDGITRMLINFFFLFLLLLFLQQLQLRLIHGIQQ